MALAQSAHVPKYDVKDEKGNVTHWTAEWNARSTLVNFGFTARTFTLLFVTLARLYL